MKSYRSSYVPRRTLAPTAGFPCDGKNDLVLFLMLALIWNSLTTVVYIKAYKHWVQEPFLFLALGLLSLLGVFLLGVTLYRTLVWFRLGKLFVTLDPHPGNIGGQVGGQIELPRIYSEKINFSLSLSCIDVEFIGSGENRSRSEKTHWQNLGFANVSYCIPVSGLRFQKTSTTVRRPNTPLMPWHP